MGSESNDTQKKLENFNDPTIVQNKSVGDLAAVLLNVLQYRSLVSSTKQVHTIGTVHALLDQLAQADDTTTRKKVFMRLATGFPANEQKWTIHIMLRDLKIGLRHERVLNFIHPDAMEMYNHTSDLYKVCTNLRNSSVRYVPKIEPFQVFSSILAKHVDFGECKGAIKVDVFVIEPKLDGEWITCHVQNGQVQFFSRNGINYTEIYGPFMTPYVLAQLKKGVDCILDGEMMVWDNMEYRMREFGLLKNIDIVYLGGGRVADELFHSVYDKPGEASAVMWLPLRVRWKLLLKLLTPLDHHITIIEQTIVDSKSAKERQNQVMAEVDRQVTNGDEGVILKDINSHYMCGESSRKAKRWLKLKPDYPGMTTNLDVIIVGGFYSTGRRRSGDVSIFLVGVLSQSLDNRAAEEAMKPGAPCPLAYTFGRVGTGYNLEELEVMWREQEPHWQPWDSNNIPPHLNGWKPQRSDFKPDVWIDPRHSKVLEVYGFELTSTTLYQTGLTIRFPRCETIRNDKLWYQCMNIQDLNAAHKSIFNKRAADVAFGQKKTMKRITKRLALPRAATGGVVAEYSQATLEGIELKCNVFEGKEFCVLPGKYKDSKQFIIPKEIMNSNERQILKQIIEKLVHSYGGTIVQNPIAETTNYVITACDTGFKVVNLKKQARFNIVYLHWVLGCMTASRLLPLKAHDFIFATEPTWALLAKDYDKFGDHFTEYVKPDDLLLIFKEVERTRMKSLAGEEAEAMNIKFTFLAHRVVYIDRYCDFRDAKEYLTNHAASGGDDGHNYQLDDGLLHQRMKVLEHQVRLFGGVVADQIDASTTHIVVYSASDRARIKQLQPIVRALHHLHSRESTIIDQKWVQECIAQHAQLPVDEYFIRV